MDSVRVDGDAAFRSLAEYFFQLHHRDHARTDDVLEHIAGPHRRELVDVAHENQGCLRGNGFEKVIH